MSRKHLICRSGLKGDFQTLDIDMLVVGIVKIWPLVMSGE